MGRFESPNDDLRRSQLFSEDEVGLTHPENDSFIKLSDDGSIHIYAGEGTGIILNPKNRSITLVADTVKLITKDSGFRWNRNRFNDKASQFQEPTLVAIDDIVSSHSIYRDVDYFLDDFAGEFKGVSGVLSEILKDDVVVLDELSDSEVIRDDEV